MNEPMTPDELARICQALEQRAHNYRSSDLADEQRTAIEFYEAEPFGDEVDGRSQIVVPVVQEVVDYMTVSVLRTCVSGDRVVEFEPPSADAAAAAEEASEAINHAFMREQDGYKVLHDWLKCGLVEKVCAVKTACIEDVKRVRQTIEVSDDQLALLMQSGANIVAADVDEETGAVIATIEEQKTVKRYVDMPLPNYEFLFSGRVRHEDEADYLCHRTKKTLSELIEMGFDREQVEDLPRVDYSNDIDGRESATWNDEAIETDNDDIPGMREVMLREEYVRVDWNGDGIAELLKVMRVGTTILDAEEVEEVPFVVFCPFPRPHRMVGNGLADKVMDLQRQKSVLMRQTFDGIYMTNAPRWWLPQESSTADTIDDLLTIQPGAIVRGKGVPPVPLSQPFDVQRMLGVLEFVTGEQESRTGITRLNQGLDADALNKTATGTALMQAQGQQIEEFVARNFGEAMARLWGKKLRLMIEHGEPMTIRVDGEFREVNPGQWPRDLVASVRVGLGSARKDQRIAYRQMIAEMQAQIVGAGMPIVGPRQVYNTVAGMVRDAQLGDPNDYVIDPDSEEGAAQIEPQGERPDPEMVKAQDEMQRRQAEFQLDAQTRQAEMEAKREEAALKLQLTQEEAAAKLQLEREKAQQEAMLAEQKFAFEARMAERKMELEAELAREQAARQHEVAMKQADARISENRPGGDLDK